MTPPGNCGGVSSDETWDRDKWTASNYCAWVEIGPTREERAARMAEVPEAWQGAVKAHVQCAFKARAEAQRRKEAKRLADLKTAAKGDKR